MTELIPFAYGDRPVRTILVNGYIAFVAADVLAVLDLNRSSVALLDDDEKGVHTVDTPGGQQEVSVITEPGLFSLILRSRKPEAKAFKRWVTHRVLPEIRRTGGYSPRPELPALPRTFAEALRELAATVEARELAEERADALDPAAHSWTTLADAGGDYSLRQAAQILDRDPVISTGQNRLSAYLRGIGWLDSGGEPYQRHVDTGRLVRRATSGYDHPDRGHVATWQVRITTKGLHELHRRMDGSGPLLLATQRERSAS